MSNIFRNVKSGAAEKHPTRFYSDKQEKSVAKVVGGKQTKNSGATMFQKEDVLADEWSFECKTCEKPQKSFSIKKEWLEKSLNESFFMGKKYNALVFNFGPDETNYAVVDLKLFNLMKEALSIVEHSEEEIDEV